MARKQSKKARAQSPLEKTLARYKRTKKSLRANITEQILAECKFLDDLLPLLIVMKHDAPLFSKASAFLVDSLPERSMSELVRIYEDVLWDSSLAAIVIDAIKRMASSDFDWYVVMDYIQHPCHELSDIAYEQLMMQPQDRTTIFKLHRITRPDSAERKFLENSLILPFIDQMPESDLVDITILASPGSPLMARAHEILKQELS